MKKKTWVITKNQFLSVEEVHLLYRTLNDAKDLAIIRNRFLCHVRDYFILHILLETGVRVSELIVLRIKDFRDGSIVVQIGKGSKPRTIILTKETQKLIRQLIITKSKILKEPTLPDDFLFLTERKKPYSTRNIRKRVKHWFSKLKFSSDLSVHSCRHTYVSNLIAAGIDLETVRNNAGHSSLCITSIYAHVVKNNLGNFELYKSST